MGWQSDDGIHEGYVVAIEREMVTNEHGYTVPTGAWRDVEGARALMLEDGKWVPTRRVKVDHVQVACECGWRSQRLLAPLGTEWIPNLVLLGEPGGGEQNDDAAYAIWRRHVEDAPGGLTPALRIAGARLTASGA